MYDIPSYLEHFGKAHKQQYDINHIKKVFDENENGRTYMFRADSDSSYCTDMYDNNGNIVCTFPILEKMTYSFKEHPISAPVKAELKETVEKEKVECCNTKFYFDFLENSYMVADNFDDIVDFITLWSYLKREALILEVNKSVTHDDISIFFEIKEKKINPDTIPNWNCTFEILSDRTDTKLPTGRYKQIPLKHARYYIDKAWEFNYEHFITCSDFVDKKIIASSELRIFKQKNFKTVEQISQRKNLFVAWFAVGISVISIIIGNIIPLFQPRETDYLDKINQQLSIVEELVSNNEQDESIIKELGDIKEVIEKLLQNYVENSDKKEYTGQPQ